MIEDNIRFILQHYEEGELDLDRTLDFVDGGRWRAIVEERRDCLVARLPAASSMTAREIGILRRQIVEIVLLLEAMPEAVESRPAILLPEDMMAL